MSAEKSAIAITGTTTVTVRVPLTFRRYGGRKEIITPASASMVHPSKETVNGAIVKALARAHRWQRSLERGTFTSIFELAASEHINPSYLARVLRLTLLAPDIVEALLSGSPLVRVTLQDLLRPFPVAWETQRQNWLTPSLVQTPTSLADARAR